jgi:hypothetical protein
LADFFVLCQRQIHYFFNKGSTRIRRIFSGRDYVAHSIQETEK